MLLLWVFLWPAQCGAFNYVIACACFHDTSMLAYIVVVIVVTNQDSTSSRLLPGISIGLA
jgi:hypothetical protein